MFLIGSTLPGSTVPDSKGQMLGGVRFEQSASGAPQPMGLGLCLLVPRALGGSALLVHAHVYITGDATRSQGCSSWKSCQLFPHARTVVTGRSLGNL